MGKTLFELAKQAQPDYPHQIILAKVDGKLHELKRQLPLVTKPIGEV